MEYWVITDRRKQGYVVVIAAVIAMVLSSCRSSPVSPSSGADMNFSYHILYRSHVTIKVDNSYGTTVLTLVDTIQDAGRYSVTWSTAAYPSGIYFYTFRAIRESGGAEMDLTKKFIVG